MMDPISSAKLCLDVGPIDDLKAELESSRNLAGKEAEHPEKDFKEYRSAVVSSFQNSRRTKLFDSLYDAYVDGGGLSALDAELKASFHGHIISSKFTNADILNQSRLADLRHPAEWFPASRQYHRTIHLHVGPTNSGKTYHALKKLEEADSGIYAGPLRLLAHEVYTRLNANGRECNLITGDDTKIAGSGKAPMSSCTVEMVPLNRQMDVAVIDEIQMIGCSNRGWAWTTAVLGVSARELHLCGEARVVPLIRQLAASTGEKLEIHQYERLSPLKTMMSSLNGDLKRLRKGDCVVVFSRTGIHAMKNEIERITGKSVAVVYGSLPPETRAQQAKLFNDPNNDYDILVASDAIGMGLNLSIKRIVFETTQKHDGKRKMTLDVSQIKQIAGRAGRYRTAEQSNAEASSDKMAADVTDPSINVLAPLPPANNLGLVTTLEHSDLSVIQHAMESEARPLKTAGIIPPASIVQRFSAYFPPQTPFSYVLHRLNELTRLNPRFHLCEQRDQTRLADLIQPMNLTINDRLIICAAPASLRDPGMPEIVKKFAQCVADQAGGGLLDIKEFKLEILDEDSTPDRNCLRRLETLHKSIVLYLWLSFRFSGVFKDRPLATHVKELVEEKIEQGLAYTAASYMLSRRQKDRERSEPMRTFLRNVRGKLAPRGGGGFALPLSWEAKINDHILPSDADPPKQEAVDTSK
ncbi:MAG: hypothetical protein M1812_000851 [Candelaria pacifica]|nr:MAG: hypothetical protein M1812_000851 [Candelaria pacifica]